MKIFAFALLGLQAGSLEKLKILHFLPFALVGFSPFQ